MSADGAPTPAADGAPGPAADRASSPAAAGSATADAVSDSVVRPGHGARAFLRLVMIEHSIFALPFAYVAALSAMRIHGGHVRWLTLVLITVAMVAGRTVAMAANRIIDRHIDAQNPRTAHRELVTGALSLRKAYVGLGVSLVVFFVSAGLLNWLCLALSPIALFFLIIYSYAKRFTDFPQVFLGLAQAIGPIGAWMGVTGHWSWTALLLGLAVGAWIGGFDCMYACQDVDVDAKIGVRSVPVRFGVRNALRASAVVHLVTLGLFVAFALRAGYGPIWWVGLGITAVILAYEHAIVRPSDLSRMTRAFFTANGVVSIVLFVFALADLVFLQGLGA